MLGLLHWIGNPCLSSQSWPKSGCVDGGVSAGQECSGRVLLGPVEFETPAGYFLLTGILYSLSNLHSFLFFHLVSFKEIVFCCSYNSHLFSSIILYVLIKTDILFWSCPSTLLVREEFPCWWGLWGWLNTWHLTPERRTWQFISHVYSLSGRRQMHASWGHFCTQKQNKQGGCERQFLQC